jgi:hypothetical protein
MQFICHISQIKLREFPIEKKTFGLKHGIRMSSRFSEWSKPRGQQKVTVEKKSGKKSGRVKIRKSKN